MLARTLASLSTDQPAQVERATTRRTAPTPRLANAVLSATTAGLNPPPANSPDPAPSPTAPSATSASASASLAASQVVHEIAGWRRALLWPFGLLLKAWGRSLRFDASQDDVRAYMKKDEPVAIVLWHNRLFLAAEIVRRYRQGRPAYALVSASQDGAWLTAFFSLAGMRTVRGSSSRLGREAAGALVEVLKEGHDVGITPDGPRGPCYELKAGSVIVARRAKAPMLLVGAEFESAWQLRSWDRFVIPKPFSRVRMRSEIIGQDQLADRDAASAALQARLLALNPDSHATRTPHSAV